jgi:predicted nucleotidyltransferase
MAKVNLFRDFKEFLESLNSAGAKYLLIGGYAVNHHGHRRHTDDLDVWISLEPATLEKVSKVLQSFAGFPASKVRPSMLAKPDKVFIFGREPVRIDILTTPHGVDFEACYARRKLVNWDGLTIPLIALKDLKANKKASGRAKDLADLDALFPSRKRRRKRPLGS